MWKCVVYATVVKRSGRLVYVSQKYKFQVRGDCGVVHILPCREEVKATAGLTHLRGSSFACLGL